MFAAVAPALILAGETAPIAAEPSSPPAGFAKAPPEVKGKVQRTEPRGQATPVTLGLRGLFGATLRLTPETYVEIGGRPASAADVREGLPIRATYEVRDGERIGTAITIRASEDAHGRAASARP